MKLRDKYYDDLIILFTMHRLQSFTTTQYIVELQSVFNIEAGEAGRLGRAIVDKYKDILDKIKNEKNVYIYTCGRAFEISIGLSYEAGESSSVLPLLHLHYLNQREEPLALSIEGPNKELYTFLRRSWETMLEYSEDIEGYSPVANLNLTKYHYGVISDYEKMLFNATCLEDIKAFTWDLNIMSAKGYWEYHRDTALMGLLQCRASEIDAVRRIGPSDIARLTQFIGECTISTCSTKDLSELASSYVRNPSPKSALNLLLGAIGRVKQDGTLC